MGRLIDWLFCRLLGYRYGQIVGLIVLSFSRVPVWADWVIDWLFCRLVWADWLIVLSFSRLPVWADWLIVLFVCRSLPTYSWCWETILWLCRRGLSRPWLTCIGIKKNSFKCGKCRVVDSDWIRIQWRCGSGSGSLFRILIWIQDKMKKSSYGNFLLNY
jgi:hypothetical protein